MTKKIFGIAGLVLSASVAVVGAGAVVVCALMALNDVDYPTCLWLAGDCRESYVNIAEMAANAVLFGVALILLSVGALKDEWS